MKKTNKKLKISILVLFILVISSVFLLSGCGDEVEQIYITSAYSPRLNYVQGQDLDIERGVLTVIIDGEETLVPMRAEGVSVTGYDKTKLGPQTITVSYAEQTTTYQVTVIPRIAAEGYEKGYFLDDAFKADKGKLKIAKDDASVFAVNMNDERVTLKSFDSSTAGTKTVELEYSDGTNTYPCTFTVEVYDASDVKMIKPNKTSYYSHDKTLDFNGGYLSIKWGNNQTKTINITEDMVSGYDFSLVTEENRTQPLKQTVTVTYLKHSFSYDITITYSGVTVIEGLLEELKDVDLNAETLELTDAQKDAAVDAILEYYTLSVRHKQLISEENMNRIVRCATVELNKRYFEAIKECEGTIILTEKGIQLKNASYDQTVEDLAKLKDETKDFNRYAEVLRQLKVDYEELELEGENTVGQSILVVAEEQQELLISALDHIVELHGILNENVVPKSWSASAFTEEMIDAIVEVTELITRETFTTNGLSGIYNILSAWRENNDLFEIIYSYYMYVAEDGQEYVKETLLSKVPMPKAIYKWYSLYYSSMYISQTLYQDLKNGTTNYYLKDVTEFMYFYDLLLEETSTMLKNESDTLTIDLYKLMEGNVAVDAVRTLYCGYYYNAGALAADESFNAIWESYIDLYTLYRTGKLVESDGKFVIGDNAAAFEAVMTNLTNLSPSELYGFLCSMNFLYGSSGGNVLVLSKYEDKGYLNTFSLLMNAYYSQVLGKDMLPMYENLVAAMENFALNGVKKDALEDFKTAMSALKSAYGKLSTGDQEKFDQYLGTAYSKYLKIYNVVSGQGSVTLDDEQVKTLFATLADTIGKIVEINDIIVEWAKIEDENKEDLKEGTYIVLFALYEKAYACYQEILELGVKDEQILLALYNNTYEIDDLDLTLETAFFAAGATYWRYISGMSLKLTNAGVDRDYCAYDVYVSTKLNTYLLASADLLYAQYKEEYTALTKDIVLASIDAFHGLDRLGVSLCRLYGGATLHFDALTAFFGTELKDDAETLALANQLVDAAKKYLEFYFAKDEDADALKDAFVALMAQIVTLKEGLDDTTGFDAYLKAFYDNYFTLYDDIVNPKPEQTPEQTPEA